jgi:hypothetical protein
LEEKFDELFGLMTGMVLTGTYSPESKKPASTTPLTIDDFQELAPEDLQPLKAFIRAKKTLRGRNLEEGAGGDEESHRIRSDVRHDSR